MRSTYTSWVHTSSFVILLAYGLTGCETSPQRSSAKPTFDTTSDKLGIARQKHAAVALIKDNVRVSDKSVLVIGGIEGPAGSVAFADIFNADAQPMVWNSSIHQGAYSNIGVNEIARLDLRATAMSDGRIIVTGGSVCVTKDDAIPCVEGMEDCFDCAKHRKLRGTALLFDPEKPDQEAWSDTGWVMKTRRTLHTVTPLPAKIGEQEVEYVFVLGGEGSSLEATAQVFPYMTKSRDPMNASLPRLSLRDGTIKPPESNALDGGAPSDAGAVSDIEWGGHTATLLPPKNSTYESARILVVGRRNGSEPCSAYLVHPDKPWEGPLPLPPEVTLPCAGHSAEIIGSEGKEMIAIIGGEIEKEIPRREVVLFDPYKPTNDPTAWSVTTMTHARSYAAAAVMKSGALLVSGGFLKKENGIEQGRAEVEQYDPVSKKWTQLPDMKCARVHHTMTKMGPKTASSLAEHFFVVGGSGDMCKDVGNPGNTAEILYLNDVCDSDGDCSPGNRCASVGGKAMKCIPASSK